MAVRAQDQFAAVLMTLPLGDHLHVDPFSMQRVTNIRRRALWL